MDSGKTPKLNEGSELSPELEQELENLAQAMVDDSSTLRQVLDKQQAVWDTACETIIPWALERGLTPEQTFEATRRDTGSAGLAIQVRVRMRAELLRRAEGEQFDQRAAEIEAMSERAVDRIELVRVLDEERERRGLPPSPSKAARDQAEAALWQQAGELALARFEEMGEEERTPMLLEGDPSDAAPTAAPSSSDSSSSASGFFRRLLGR